MSRLNIKSVFSNDTLLANNITFGVNMLLTIILDITATTNDIDLFGNLGISFFTGKSSG